MSVLRYILPAVAITKAALGQKGPCAGTTTLQSQGDATALAPCQTWDGTIAIATTVAETITLPTGLLSISGDLVAENAVNMTGLGGSVRRIGGAFRIHSAQGITSLQFEQLEEVDEIDWLTITQLYQLTFGTPGVTSVNSLSIADTALANLDGISPTDASQILISNNGGLKRVEMQVTNVTGNVTFDSNGNKELNLLMPNLEGAGAMSINGCNNIDLPSLSNVNGSAEFFQNPMLETLSFPNLTDAGGLRVTGNSALSNLSTPVLQMVNGAINIQNNTALTGTIDFPQLEIVRGAVRLTGGNWEDFEIPKIQRVRGATALASSQDITKLCQKYQAIAGPNSQLQGKFSCRGGANADGSGGNAGGSGAGGNPNSASSLFNPASAGTLGALGMIVAVFAQL